MAIDIATQVKNEMLMTFMYKIATQDGSGKLLFYGDPRPTSGKAITTQTKYAEATMPPPNLSSIQFGVFSVTGIPSALVLMNGKIGWVRLVDGSGNWITDLNVGLSGSQADVIVTDVNVLQGGSVIVHSLTFSL